MRSRLLLVVVGIFGSAVAVCPALADVVVLKDGYRLLEGMVEREEGRVVVVSKGRRVAIPSEDVDRIRPTKQDVYQERKTEIAQRDPDEHYQLALWCRKYELFDEAIAQCLATLALKPNHKSAQGLKVALENARKRAKGRTPKSRLKPRWEWTFDQWRNRQERNHLKQFHEKIEMLLLQSCGAGKCHGGAGYRGTFRLTRPTAVKPSSSNHTQRNLVALYRALDQRHPARSPLLTFSLKKPPDHPVQVYESEDDETYRVLHEWVMGLKTPRTATLPLTPSKKPPLTLPRKP